VLFTTQLFEMEQKSTRYSVQLPCLILMLVLQPLRWCCVKCVIYHERDVREEQHHYICGANKQ